MDKQKILYELHKRDYIRELQERIRNSLVGSMFDKYLLRLEESQTSALQGNKSTSSASVFHAVVDCLVANLIYSTSEKFVDEILKVMEELQREGVKKNDL